MINYDCAPYHFIKTFPVKCEMSYKKILFLEYVVFNVYLSVVFQILLAL